MSGKQLTKKELVTLEAEEILASRVFQDGIPDAQKADVPEVNGCSTLGGDIMDCSDDQALKLITGNHCYGLPNMSNPIKLESTVD